MNEVDYNKDLIRKGRIEYRTMKLRILELQQELKQTLQIVQLLEFLTRTGKLWNIDKYNKQVNNFTKQLLITTRNVTNRRREFDEVQKGLSF